jgi:hypothetical protein
LGISHVSYCGFTLRPRDFRSSDKTTSRRSSPT